MRFMNYKALNFKQQAKELKNVRNMVICGLFLAIYIVLYALKISITPTQQIRFGFLALSVAGMYGGPLMGITIGVLGDFLSYFIAGGQGGYFIGFTLTYALIGMAYGLFLYDSKITTLRVILATVFEFIVNLFLNTLWLSIMIGTPYIPLLITKAPMNILILVIKTILLIAALNPIKKAIYSIK